MRILFLGDIVGEPGRKAVITHLNDIKRQEEVDFCIVNGENSAGGRGQAQMSSLQAITSGTKRNS